ncbi:MAG TPA: MarR family transcriptional regulator [Streptosporangiaceae bacterium]|jgi:DNA-binding MarR family transcriptional regulator|nr:MarR family transcriptional regulator [Streptosporangiaceae bacterium]
MPTSAETEQAAAVEHADLVDVIVQTSFATMAVLNRVAAEHDLSLTQLRVLAILRDRRLRMTELARYLGLDKSTMTGLVDRAEKRGLLRRARDPADGRAVDVFLSADGARAAERGHEQIARLLAPMTGTLSRADQHRVQILLAAMLSGRPG